MHFHPVGPALPITTASVLFSGQPLYLWILDSASLSNVSCIRDFVRMSYTLYVPHVIPTVTLQHNLRLASEAPCGFL